ncbi:MAG TPA: TauD/TfdA family dioxygenase, partial [Candidatus Dormibacteraeota bacterium]|nr:TauD/TfdA family dioxygenase [Candidatus Dormibacteraeota bacterium]
MNAARGQSLPLVISPAAGERELIDHVAAHRDRIRTDLLAAGAILFRGFHMGGVDAFERVVAAISGEPLEYRERSSPRSRVEGNVYTSTDYPAGYPIFQHHESSYAQTWPLRLFFYCDIPAEQGGETPVADGRRVLGRIDPAVRRRFAEVGVMYVRNFGEGLGLSWSTAFQTEDPAEVERYCRASGMRAEWRPGGALRTRSVRPALVRHPLTGEELWFNHGTFFHVTTLEPAIRDYLVASYAPDELPANTFYGDGTPIEDDVLDHLRDCYRAETVSFPWRGDDVLLIDNMLASHGRAPYRG